MSARLPHSLPHLLFAALLAWACLMTPTAALGQNATDEAEQFMTWDEFLAEYMERHSVYEDHEEAPLLVIDYLEQCHAHPLNINTATRDELLDLAFIDEAQADSIIAYRKKHRRIITLGELQLISRLSYDDRRWLSLFTFAGDTVTPAASFKQVYFGGKHQIVARLDAPLYQRAGQRTYSTEELLQNPNRIYLGNGLSNTVRYRYTHANNVAYGLTLQKDAGEPFANRDNYPYDYVSAYVHRRLPHSGHALWLGDYEVRTGQGLLLGHAAFGGRTSLVERLPSVHKVIRPHTSAAETGFMRGVAATFVHHNWQLTAFGSWLRIDGRVTDDTIRSLKTDGLHRTLAEMERKNVATQLTVGTRIEHSTTVRSLGATLLYDHFSLPVWPDLRTYNRHYFRGQHAAGLAIDYRQSGRKWDTQAELAVDRHMYPALSSVTRLELRLIALTLQFRHFSPRYVAPHADAIARQSRAQNETGLLFGLTMRPIQQLAVTAYADLFYHPHPLYRVSKNGSKGMEASLQARYTLTGTTALEGRYRWTLREQDITGHKGLLQYVQTHRMRYALVKDVSSSLTLRTAVDASLITSQTSRPAMGWMLSSRATCQLSRQWSAAAFAAVFFTDDYATRLYAYEPQMRYGGAFPSYAYHGLKTVALANYSMCPALTLSARYSLLHYFNRSQISSGTQLIDSSSQNDLSVQLLWQF